jgi:hypothetical protein
MYMAPIVLIWTVALCTFIHATAQKVKVDFYYESACPFSVKFVNEILLPFLTTPGILENVVDFESYPSGNAYYVTPECGGSDVYSMTARLCWEKRCGYIHERTAADNCFAGELVCQHGELECKFNRALACVKKVGASPLVQMNLFICLFNGAGAAATTDSEAQLASDCASQTGTPWNAAQSCWVASGEPNGAMLSRQEAAATPTHPSVPYVIVNGQAIDHDKIFQEVCRAYKGPPLAACAPYTPPALLL